MRIGILKTGQSPEVTRAEHGDYDDMFERLLAGRGFTFDSYHVEELDFPASVHAAQGWLITGSRHGVYENHPFIARLEDFIRDAFAAEVPMVGVCFGHQIIAQAMGGRVVKHPGGWRVGANDYVIGGQPMVLNAWHQDQVVDLPHGATVAGTNEFCQAAALIYDHRAFTVQPHPEFRDGFIDGLIDHRGGPVPPDLLDRARARRGQADPLALADRIEAFFKNPQTTAEGLT
ncbi:type 1 glutamine amidotransferase [Paracoccus sp. MC1854]|uniref:type 1 glutamine amidotransferase n=1 Tax=Paracoccus sp. MC1854 TaxID=2760306 RepID=UPI0016018AEB|nr:type 1 glutamine amidotransferase [Paracoccus sp. MC1854]MBB1491967.1 type 1 glutamine amidotransferase [Paracoccus sp. MC1854]